MNGIVRTALRLPSLKNLVNPMVNRSLFPVKRDFNRSFWHMCSGSKSESLASVSILHKNTTACSCGCGIKRIHTKGERELVEFLTEEILAEKKTQKVKTIPSTFEGFQVSLSGAEVTLTRKSNDETVNISFNVNHTVDSEPSEMEEGTSEKQEMSEMRSKPQFEVDFVRGKSTLSFTCSFIQDNEPTQEGDGYNDVFGIDEITMYEGEWSDKTYAVAGDVLDGYLYDLLMNLLEEKGISNEFAEKLADFSTVYEQSAYIGLLESLSKFTTGAK